MSNVALLSVKRIKQVQAYSHASPQERTSFHSFAPMLSF